MTDENLMTLQEKREYVNRITKKALDENITYKEAANRLELKVWNYYKFKSELRQLDSDRCRSSTDDGKDRSVEKHGETLPISLTLRVTPDVMAFLESEAKSYATDAEIVGQLLLHECVRGKIAKAKGKDLTG